MPSLDTPDCQCYTSLALINNVLHSYRKVVIVMKKIGIVYHPMIKAAYSLAKKLEEDIYKNAIENEDFKIYKQE